MAPHFKHEHKLRKQGAWPVAGVDEAGRGPLAGPVVASAVILDPDNLPDGLDDSKKLTARAREFAYKQIFSKALAIGIGLSPAHEIDRVNIRQATHLVMRRAIFGLAMIPAHALIDGNDLPKNLPCPGTTLVKGDAHSLSIAAASIIAKVTRDRLMQRLSEAEPQYGFAQHAGYGTLAHRQALILHGPGAFHRLTFAPIKNLALPR
jgi:ribonuclease HII